MTHVIIVQCSTKLSYQGKWGMVSLWVCNTLEKDKDIICVCNCDDLSREIMKFHIFPFISRNIHAHICLVNRPVALRGHVTNASLKRWVGILLMPKVDRAHKNYLTPEIWEEKHLREIFYGTLIFQQSSMICIGRHVGGHTLALQHGGQNYVLLISC